MKISGRTKFLLVASTVLGLLSFLVIVDLGVNAGRIHHGVEVSGIDVGGLTEDEAYGKLYPIGEDMSETPIVFFGNTFECRVVPEELGWGPQVAGTADAAFGVGRAAGFFEDGLDRVKAWFGKADVRWTGKPNTRRVGAWINQCDKAGSARGMEVDKANLRFLLKTALRTWPRPQIWDISAEG